MVLEWWQVEKWQKIAFCAKLPLFSNPLTIRNDLHYAIDSGSIKIGSQLAGECQGFGCLFSNCFADSTFLLIKIES